MTDGQGGQGRRTDSRLLIPSPLFAPNPSPNSAQLGNFSSRLLWDRKREEEGERRQRLHASQLYAPPIFLSVVKGGKYFWHLRHSVILLRVHARHMAEKCGTFCQGVLCRFCSVQKIPSSWRGGCIFTYLTEMGRRTGKTKTPRKRDLGRETEKTASCLRARMDGSCMSRNHSGGKWILSATVNYSLGRASTFRYV